MGDNMEVFMTDELWNLLLTSMTFSIFLMALIQKVKTLRFFKKKWHVWFLNLAFSFIMGIPFSMQFFHLDLNESIWVSVFGFIGAPSIYQALKKQNIINVKPKSATENNDYIEIPKKNEIKRSDLS